jgi:DNA processing protein
MDERAYWIWISHGLRPGSSKIKRILQYAGSVEAFYEAGPKAWASTGLFTRREWQSLKDFTPRQGEYQLEYCERLGLQVFSPNYAGYPDCLRNISAPPCVFYVKGRLPDFDRVLSVCVVGSRECTPSGRTITRRISGELAGRGAVIVSGGALGIDACAHEAAIGCGGVTVAFLGCGIYYPYLITNAGLRDRIGETGALISEYPPDAGVDRGNFPVRNRLMAAVSRGVLVTEARLGSGTSSTVRHALEQGKDVFAVPGDASLEQTAGTNEMIKSGAIPVTCAGDILSYYSGKSFDKPYEAGSASGAPAENPAEKLSGDEAALYQILSSGPQHISILQQKLGWPAGRVLTAATRLELSGLAESCAGRRYRRL